MLLADWIKKIVWKFQSHFSGINKNYGKVYSKFTTEKRPVNGVLVARMNVYLNILTILSFLLNWKFPAKRKIFVSWLQDPKNIEISHLKTYHALLVKTVLKFSFSHETLLRLWYVKPSQNNNFNILREALSFTWDVYSGKIFIEIFGTTKLDIWNIFTYPNCKVTRNVTRTHWSFFTRENQMFSFFFSTIWHGKKLKVGTKIPHDKLSLLKTSSTWSRENGFWAGNYLRLTGPKACTTVERLSSRPWLPWKLLITPP